MAVQFVTSALGATNSTTSFSITLPATQAGDIIILEYVHRGTGDATLGGTYNGGSWAEKHDQQFNGSTFSGKTVWSRATGNHNGQTVTGASLTNSCAAIITIYRGALASGDPLADATIVGEPNASGNETQPEITTTTNGAWVVLVVVNSPDLNVTDQACTSPGALAARAERLSTGGTDSSIAHASAEKATAGATGAFTWTQSDAASGSWAYAIKPDVPAVMSQAAFRGKHVSTNVDTGVYVAALNTNFSWDRGFLLRMRFVIQQTAAAANSDLVHNFKLQFNKNSGGWTDVAAQGATTAAVRYANMGDLADDGATTQQIGSGTFVTGRYDENGSASNVTFSSAATSETEMDFSIEVYPGQVATGDTIEMRVIEGDGTVLSNYAQTPTVTVLAPESYPVTDTFTDTNGVILVNHTPDDGGRWRGNSVTSVTSTQAISSNAASEIGFEHLNTAQAASAEYDVECDMDVAQEAGGAGDGLDGRWDPTVREGYQYDHYEDTSPYSYRSLSKFVAGTATSLTFEDASSTLYSYGGVAKTVKLEIRDATKKVYVDGVEWMSSADNAVSATGYAGFYVYSSGAGSTADNFSATESTVALITGIVATADAASLLGSITAIRITSIVGEVASGDAAALAGLVQIARSITGELATADSVAFDGTITAIRIVSISGELASATSASLDGVITAVRIASIAGEPSVADADGLSGAIQISISITGELATVTSDALEGVITAQSENNASVIGEVSEATADGFAAVITAARIVSIAGEASQATATTLEGTVTSVRITSVTGEFADATANALSGSIQVARSVSGEVAQADAAALSGSVQVSASIVGVAASATADALDGTATSVRITSIVGESATADAAALEAVITALRVISVIGEVAQATAEALEGTITTVRSVSIAGESATADAVSLEGVVSTLPSANIDGAVATADAAAIEAVITAVQIVSISGEVASADANALEGTISTGAATNVNVSAEPAEATADSLDGVISALRSISIVGELATSDSAAMPATITTVRIVVIFGELSIANAAALVGSVVIVPVVSVSISAETSLATADALAGTITIEVAGEVEPIFSGLVELEDLIDRQIWPDNVDPSGAIFPRSESVPSGYIEPVEETNPSGFQKQSDRTELWNL